MEKENFLCVRQDFPSCRFYVEGCSCQKQIIVTKVCKLCCTIYDQGWDWSEGKK